VKSARRAAAWLQAAGARAGGMLLAGAAACAANVQAADAAAGRARAHQCTACHGQFGLSSVPDAPNLAGQPVVYLRAQLKAYRSGERRHEVMNVVAKALTDSEIDNLAAWYAVIRIEATPPN
jgi:cytochrome c553